tara:strand:+ start:1910 stop:2452 length:543 start_codon:yes stop_codon:yes gene_type:complete
LFFIFTKNVLADSVYVDKWIDTVYLSFILKDYPAESVGSIMFDGRRFFLSNDNFGGSRVHKDLEELQLHPPTISFSENLDVLYVELYISRVEKKNNRTTSRFIDLDEIPPKTFNVIKDGLWAHLKGTYVTKDMRKSFNPTKKVKQVIFVYSGRSEKDRWLYHSIDADGKLRFEKEVKRES